MERYTEWDREHKHGSGLSGKDCFTKLAEYEDLEEQGLLLQLPCKVGEKLYAIMRNQDGYGIEEYEVAKYEVDYSGAWLMRGDRWACGIRDSANIKTADIGKTVFFARADAESKLKELEEIYSTSRNCWGGLNYWRNRNER